MQWRTATDAMAAGCIWKLQIAQNPLNPHLLDETAQRRTTRPTCTVLLVLLAFNETEGSEQAWRDCLASFCSYWTGSSCPRGNEPCSTASAALPLALSHAYAG